MYHTIDWSSKYFNVLDNILKTSKSTRHTNYKNNSNEKSAIIFAFLQPFHGNKNVTSDTRSGGNKDGASDGGGGGGGGATHVFLFPIKKQLSKVNGNRIQRHKEGVTTML
uniref:Uncharacterized protein n=1 Tax=Glossina palpalis gambiensis TaxID=67801 RepID=A0A1B0AR74_9MUSC